ncbi:HU family DNA-binding protein [Breznakiella homolactica]|uniref:HU family DNA-binding protein n=1 Tax=Breznakiella homolactica TaxID=2798577 RepID=A0A7T7XQ09_9SPIR|nr:HU family DNA-binding protein [Breznakiella homolactica]QQO10267.1 HU family DNA-binding protein [Breznakiella homolactica]
MVMEDLPSAVQAHLEHLLTHSGLPDTKEFRERLAQAWCKKCDLFEQQAKVLQLEMTGEVARNDPRGFIVLTYSGSIVSVGTGAEKREVEYASIHLRGDVPKSVEVSATALAEDVRQKHPVTFSGGKLKKTSAVYFIAVCPGDWSADIQNETIREAMIYLTNGFLKINQSIHIDRKNIPDHFTSKSMARYIAKKHDLTGAEAQRILDDYNLLIETGMLLGESVPLGKIGRLSLKTKEAQKARIVKHPETGEEMVIKSKPPVAVPRISFSKHIKDKAAALPVRTDDTELGE